MTSIPYGLRDIKITPFTTAAATTLGTPSVDLPYAQTMSFTEAEEFSEMRGDDKLVATVGQGSSIEWELAAGGLSLEAVKTMLGGTVTVSGVTPNVKTTFRKKVTDIRPYFQVEGQVISDGGGDVHCKIFRCRASGEFSGEFADGSFFTTGISGSGLPSKVTADVDVLYEFTENETATAIA